MIELFVGGEWRPGSGELAIRSPFSGDVVETVAVAGPDEVELALASAVEGAREMAALPTHRRAAVLEAAAQRIQDDLEALARTITAEQGKPLAESRAEAGRIPEMLRLSAAEAKRLSGEVLAMDAAPAGEGRLGFTLREPCGVVVAVTPFNYPALLVTHKVGPALAAGNAVILKPASTTPLTALFLVRVLAEAGVPPRAIQCVVGSGATVGDALCSDLRVRKISFTGSRDVGMAITRVAGLKRITCELGANSALVVFDDADLAVTAAATVTSGFSNAGQACISAQRVLVPRSRRDEFVHELTARVAQLRVGDPLASDTTIGPMTSAVEAERVGSWIDDARKEGAEVVSGGGRDGSLVQPSILVEPSPESLVWREELFGPAVAVRSFADDAEALAFVNDTRYGLSVGAFTSDIDRAIAFARGAHSGVVHINWGPLWRTDFMPYGGFGDSGFGKEGVRYAIEEMTEQKLVVIHPGRP
jgi:acyl-CoA reductase-like NAD-dependent aldehyde dehydrogenase